MNDIKAEVTSDQTYAAAYAVRDVNAIAAIYNSRTENGIVPSAEFLAWTAANGLRSVIEDLSVAKDSPLRSSALALRDVLSGVISGLDLSRAGNVTLLNSWLDAAVITTPQVAELIAMSQRHRAATIEEIAAALYLPSGEVI